LKKVKKKKKKEEKSVFSFYPTKYKAREDLPSSRLQNKQLQKIYDTSGRSALI